MKTKAKRLAALLAAVGLMLAAAGCGGQEKQEGAPIDLDAAVKAVQEVAGFTEELVAQDDDTILRSYPKLPLESVEAYTCNVSGSMGTPEEISIFLAKTENDVEAVRAAVDRRLEDQKLSFEDYRPEEMPKIENAVVVEKGRYVMLAVCANSGEARQTLESL